MRGGSRKLITDVIARIHTGGYDNPEMEQLLTEIADRLHHTSGKLVYGYLPKGTKGLIDKAVDLLAADERIAKLYDLWYEQKEEILRTYNKKLPRDMRRVYGYLLNRRFIERDVITFFARRKMLYEDAAYHNAVFVEYDEKGVTRHAHKRSTYSDSDFKGNVDSSQPEYSFHWLGTSDCLYVFEAPVDLLSYLTLHRDGWQEHSYVALCCAGLRAAVYQAQQNAYVREVIVCTDYDEAGIEAYYRIREALAETSRITVLREYSCYKDWNEDIQAQHGLTPIPGGEHPRIEHIRELCGQILDSGLPPCPPRPLEQLRKKVETLAGTPASNQLEIQEQACALAGLALSFCRQRMRQIGIVWQPEQLVRRIMYPYQPHRDHIGYHSRIRELEDCMQGILRQFGADRIYTESELKQEMSQTLELALHSLRTFLELQTPEQAAMLAM